MFLRVALMVSLAACLSSCVCSSKCPSQEKSDIVAIRATSPITIDGKLDEKAWQDAPAHDFVHPAIYLENRPKELQEFFSKGVVEKGTVKIVYDDKNIYFAFELEDKDILAEGNGVQLHHYRLGDTAEIFLKPLNETWYWELYVTPHSQQTSFRYDGRGVMGLPSSFSTTPMLPGMKSVSTYVGTLNNSWDEDTKWYSEVVIPLDELTQRGVKLDDKTPWLVFFGRYNYGRSMPLYENSVVPKMNRLNHHSYEEFGLLKLK